MNPTRQEHAACLPNGFRVPRLRLLLFTSRIAAGFASAIIVIVVVVAAAANAGAAVAAAVAVAVAVSVAFALAFVSVFVFFVGVVAAVAAASAPQNSTDQTPSLECFRPVYSTLEAPTCLQAPPYSKP